MVQVEVSLSARKQFIQALEIRTPSRVTQQFFATQPAGTLPGPRVQDHQPGDFVDAGSVVSFVSGLSADHQIAVLNSTLLAQLAANKQFDREQSPMDWYKFYRNVLEHLGWVVQEFGFTQYQAAGNTFTMDKAVLEILSAIATQNELAAIKGAIDAAKALADGDGRITLFDHSSSKGASGSFQIGVASDAGNAIAMKLGALYFTTQTNVTKVLWFTFSKSSTTLNKSSQAITLNMPIYDQVKADVEAKLGKSCEELRSKSEYLGFTRPACPSESQDQLVLRAA
jgi:hypothetical protein